MAVSCERGTPAELSCSLSPDEPKLPGLDPITSLHSYFLCMLVYLVIYMTLGSCLVVIFCSRGTYPPREVPRVCGPSTREHRVPNGMAARAEQAELADPAPRRLPPPAAPRRTSLSLSLSREAGPLFLNSICICLECSLSMQASRVQVMRSKGS